VLPAARISTIVIPRGNTTRASAASSFMRNFYPRPEEPMHTTDGTESLTSPVDGGIIVPGPLLPWAHCASRLGAARLENPISPLVARYFIALASAPAISDAGAGSACLSSCPFPLAQAHQR
jgi:hypothetical protein